MNAGKVKANRELAGWLISQRRPLEECVKKDWSGPWLTSRSAEYEALRRFRSYLGAALLRGEAPQPALDDLRVDEARTDAVLRAWCDAILEQSTLDPTSLKPTLEYLLLRFQSGLRARTPARKKSGAPRTKRRAVIAAIDRIADAFFAIDLRERTIIDLNPAAGALCGTPRDALLQTPAEQIVAPHALVEWWEELDCLDEIDEARRFHTQLRNCAGVVLPVEVIATRFARREGSIALVVARPLY